MAILYVDGARFRRAIVAGADWVRHTRDHLNKINVFPVPDGDTGTNMALSLSATASAVRHGEGRDLGEVMDQVAEASILGAKGNSGLILAHWFLGLRKAVGQKGRITALELAKAFEHASEAVYAAIEKPVEGTILTVMRAGASGAQRAADQGADVNGVLDEVLDSAEDALAKTPEMLAVLREAQVVDAGAQGYVNFLHGVKRALLGAPPPDFSEDALRDVVAHPISTDGDLTHRFCTELVVRGHNFNPDRLRAHFTKMGDSLLVATTGDIFKLHIHTDHPDEVMHAAGRLGVIEERKVDDMQQQRDELGHQQEPIVPLEAQPSTVAVLCDSTGDIPRALREELGIEQVPLQILFGDQVFRDQVDLSTEEFYRRLVEGGRIPSTSQPPPRAFVEALERIRDDREVVVCSLASGLSGTYRSALSGAKLARQPRVEVFDSESACMGLGLITLCAARYARMGASTDEILAWLERWREDTHIVFTVATLEYLRRGGRIGRAQGLIGSLLGVRPILAYQDGEVQPLAKARGNEKAFDELLASVEQRVPEGTRMRVGLGEITETGRLDAAEERLRARYDLVEVIRTPISGIVGTHTGPGAWGIFYQTVREDDPLL